jgi:hypothetical protein
MNTGEVETQFGQPRAIPSKNAQQLPPEIAHAQNICAHAYEIVALIAPLNIHPSAKRVVENAFELAIEYDKRMQIVMNNAVASLPKIQKPPAGMLVK